MTFARVVKSHRPLMMYFASVVFFLSGLNKSQASDYFNPALLELDKSGVHSADLALFESGAQAPGIYRVEILVNSHTVDTRDVMFTVDTQEKDRLTPCLSVQQLEGYGLKPGLLPAPSGDNECASLAAIPQAGVRFDFAQQQLLLSIPQAALVHTSRGYVAPERWDEGITALLLNYSLSGATQRSRGVSANNLYVNLRPGVNIGPWRLRNYMTWQRDESGRQRWDTVYSWLQRDIVSLRSRLMLGDSASPADIFDSLALRGVQMVSDDDMLPDSLKGYAPVIRGIARSNARVVVEQNGYMIYQTYVAPGAFLIADMYPTGGAGDLQVTIEESDGSRQYFVVPFASLPVLRREGSLKYAATMGRYQAYDRHGRQPIWGQASASYGLPGGLTIYGGVQHASVYRALALGVGSNLGRIGALSADVTQAASSLQSTDKRHGQSWRLRYSKSVAQTGTYISVAGYRYSTRGYYNLQEVLDSRSSADFLVERRRQRTELTLNQPLGENRGSLSASVVREDYWNKPYGMVSWSLGYNNSWRGIGYSLVYTCGKNGRAGNNGSDISDQQERTVALNISVSLSHFMPNTWANYNLIQGPHNSVRHSAGISGVALKNRALNWNVQQGYDAGGQGYSASLSANYKGASGEGRLGYSYSEDFRRASYGIDGGILLHGDGITLAQSLGETNILVKAPGAAGVAVNNQDGVITDSRGYAVANYASPYRENDVVLNTTTLPEEVELTLAAQTVVPGRGAIVRANFATHSGKRILMTLYRAAGQVVPFGAMVSLDGGSFIVGEKGQVYITGAAMSGTLLVKWGNAGRQSCRVSYSLSRQQNHSGIFFSHGYCH
ncbi:fimbria/pilus outer membrane usher protein [Entomohabitans teleogrylli]|uniref:fimbria/pilus outer membrane usher protein n=1 Tax=Entomohabitans teleogrylli TaxID=1384589 RepID=UPI000AFEBF32|nr:fimbria/pilus outer membrane usher protein [Entomohabitans teleogrylli]